MVTLTVIVINPSPLSINFYHAASIYTVYDYNRNRSRLSDNCYNPRKP
jgi:hypothetical protein